MKRNSKALIWSILFMVVFIALSYYIILPPLNIQSPSFWIYIFLIIVVFSIVKFIGCIDMKTGALKTKRVSKITKGFYIGVAVVFLGIIVVNIIVSPLFNSSSYAKRITIREDGNFSEEVAEVDFNTIPLLDKDSSQKLGDRVMGEMTDLVSQFYVSNLYTQINYNDEVVRVTPLEYSGIIKYFTNRSEGVKGYIIVSSTDGKAELVQLEKGMKYMPSAMFNEKLERKLRFSYPTEIFGSASFELDDEGNPYWVVPTIKYSGVGLKEEITGVVILDPITGESEKYKVEDVPTWVDHVYSARLILEQVSNWGLYKNGFFNSIFGQKDVVVTTEGYNYLTMDDDVYLYTGITSVASDESNLGFILCNMRTKETVYYPVPGAEEYSAMESAKGQVQQMNYTSTFPLLINLEGRPTYLISLKDNAGLVKMYAFVDVQDYQRVVVTDSSKGIDVAARNYLTSNPVTDTSEIKEKEIVVSSITSSIIDGNTYYYLKDNEGKKYKVSIKVDEDYIPFIVSGNRIKIGYQTESDVTTIVKIIR